ncbi:MAG: hypothetical protein HGJ94_14070 [Desulfosarcina sp.]|nr:hypothetical protein [Desulfosarcina sp.]MBC2741542.1 hypothetical protein [Desulfosarcina sp.]MBC2764456.1 hypothetical protein [Desulfosarcina sp.]
MLGKMLLRLVLDDLDTDEVSDEYADRRKLFDCLDQAAAMFVRETGLLRATKEITTVADSQSYVLPPDFINLYVRDSMGNFYIRYTDADENDNHPCLTSYDLIFRANNTESEETPCRFAVMDQAAKSSVITGTASSAGAQADDGSCVLTDSTKAFTGANLVYPRDVIHNTTDGSYGYVLEVTDDTHLEVALFEGTDNDFTSSDAYVIQPGSQYQLILDYPSATAGHTITVPYVCMPSPVYHDTGWWRFNPRHCRAIVSGAATLFKMPKREFSEAAQIGGLFAQEITRSRQERAVQILSRKNRNRR